MTYKLNSIFKKNSVLITLMVIYIIICLIIKYNFIDFINKIDELARGFVESGALDFLTKAMEIITKIGNIGPVLGVLAVSLILFKDKITRTVFLFNITLVGLLTFLLKILFSRERPLEAIIKIPTDYSFPSGHTFFAVGFYGLVAYFISKSSINKGIKVLFISIITLLIFLIGISRIYLGVHHFTDVIGGTVFGVLGLLISINTYKVLKEETR